MLTPSDLPDHLIAAHLEDCYGARVAGSTFLPFGADANAAAYRVAARDGATYFLKLRRNGFAEAALAVPAFLRRERAIAPVMAPLPAADGRLWTIAHGFGWALYPYVAGENAFNLPLSAAQWVALGRAVGAVHRANLPAALTGLLPREDYSPRLREAVLGWLAREAGRPHDDPVAAALAAFLAERRDEVRALVERAGVLGRDLARRAPPLVVCHADLHAWNVMVAEDGTLFVVDWDEVVLAPRERDLMFSGGGVGGIWRDPAEEALFYKGYGAAEVDRAALAYYRCERIVADVAAACEGVFGAQLSAEDRALELGFVTGQFAPGGVVEIAHRTFEEIAPPSPNV